MKMKRLALPVLLLALLGMSGIGVAQYIPLPPQINNAPSATAGPGGLVTTPSGLLINVSPGPIYCQGDMGSIGNTQFSLLANQTYYVFFDCRNNVVTASFTAPASQYQILLSTVVTGASTVSSATDGRAAIQFPNMADGYFVVAPNNCLAAITGTAGAGNGTVVLDGSVAALKASSTAAGASNATFTCMISVPGRLTTGKGVTINDITYLYSVQTTTATSMVASTLGSFTAPAAATGETASAAALVTQGGALTQTPVIGSANLTAVSAGQYYSEKVALGTPLVINTDLQTFTFTFQINQSASAAQIVTCPGLVVHYTMIPL